MIDAMIDLPQKEAMVPRTLAELRRTFEAPDDVALAIDRARRNAAVAMVFSRHTGSLALCVGKRASFDGDPWSGDMAFPGGKGEPGDKTYHEIAARETFEETGLVIGRNQLIGALDPLQTFSTPTRPALIVRPLIYALEQPPQPFKINSELDEAHWVPVEHLWDPRHLTTVTWARSRQPYPGIDYEGRVIWGFTLRMLYNFSAEIGSPLNLELPER